MNERGQFIPAFIYAILCCMFSDFLFLTPALVANLFLLIEIDFLFSVYKKERASSEIFDLGFFISVSSLIYFPSLAFLIFLLAGMLVLRPLRLSEWMILLVGALIPYFLTAVYYFWFDRLTEFSSIITFHKLMNEEFSFVNNAQVILITFVVGLALIWSFVKIQSNYFKTVVQIRNYFVVMMLFSFLGFLSAFMQSSIQPEHFIWLIIPVAMAISYSVQFLKKYWLAEILNLSLLLLIIYFQFQNQLNFFE